MSSWHTLLRNAIVLFGLVAIVLGAFEHEDLIFQDSDEPGSVCRSDAGGASDDSRRGGALGAVAPATGTESAFRPEAHALGWVERHDSCVEWLAPASLHGRVVSLAVTTSRAPRCIPQSSSVALRL